MTDLAYPLTFRRGHHHDPEPCRYVGFICGTLTQPPLWEVETPDGDRHRVPPENVEEPRHDT